MSKKLMVLSASEMLAMRKGGTKAVSSTKSVLRAHARVISYADRIDKMEKSAGKTVSSILSAFEVFNKAVIKRIGNTGLTAIDIVTPAVREEIIKPYQTYLESIGGAKNIQSAIDNLNAKRAKELEKFGKTEETAKEINRLYDLQINRFVRPLQVIEAQFNSLDTLKKEKGKFSAITNATKKLLTTAPIAEAVVVDGPLDTE